MIRSRKTIKTPPTSTGYYDPEQNATTGDQYSATKKSTSLHQRKSEQAFYLLVVLLQTVLILFLLHRHFASNTSDDIKVIVHEGKHHLFHGGSPAGKHKGSCFCGSKDEYCMCSPSLAIDLIITDETDEHVWLVRRKDTNQLATMGGFVKIGESTEETVRRELKEETGLELDTVPTLFGIYTDPTRDSRRHTASAVYVARVPEGVHPRAGDDVKSVEKLAWGEIMSGESSFFCDHETILKDYYHKRVEKGSFDGDGNEGDERWDDVKRSICPL